VGQCENKSGYYHNYKTRFGDQPERRPKSWVGLTIDQVNIRIKIIIIIVLNSFGVDLESIPNRVDY